MQCTVNMYACDAAHVFSLVDISLASSSLDLDYYVASATYCSAVGR